MRLLLASAAVLAALIPAAALAAPPPAVEKDAHDRIYAAATEGMTPEEIKDPSVLPAWMTKTKPKMFRKVDINGDALADWLVDYEQAPNPSFFCGTGGCQKTLFVAEADGTYRKVYTLGGSDLKFSGPKTDRRVEVYLHGSACNSFGASECLRAYRWDTALGRYVEVPNSKGLALLAGGPMPTIETDLASAPAAVRADIALRRAACEKAGGALPDDLPTAYDIPDFNGDGVRDWIVGSAYDDCHWEGDRSEDPPPVRRLFLASSAGGFVKAFETSHGAFDMDLSVTPARIIIIQDDEECGMGGEACPRQPLEWDAASATLQPVKE